MIVRMHSIHTLFTSKVQYNNNENIFIRIMYTVLLHRTTILFKIDSMAGTRYYQNQEVN